MSEEKPLEYYAEFAIRVKEKGINSGSYGQEIFCQRVAWSYVLDNPMLISTVIAVINKLEVPHV